jgi:hypothetical protein
MLELTPEQQQAVRQNGGTPPRLVDPETKTAYVLIREDVYEGLQAGAYDASPWTDEELDLLAAEDADSLGWEGIAACPAWT